MKKDKVDKIVEDWLRERPELDPAPMEIVGRILLITKMLEKRLDGYLKPFNLTLWSFDLLATLRRQGPPFTLSPSQLSEDMMLSSGAITNRIDRLETLGFVIRKHDPNDRRGYLISLSQTGKELIDQAIEARFDEAQASTSNLKKREFEQLASILKTMMLHLSVQEKNA
jgi:DNA-binding MarR family transcriptional regulator